MKLKDIKLIIWDLDETFWQGTISEEKVQLLPEHIQFIKDTTDLGIVNSICSKNDLEVVKSKLIEENLWDFFVFPSVDWSSKGYRIERIIITMKLRPANVLFVDDNVQNLEEAKHFCSEIMTAFPNELLPLICEASNAEKTDLNHKRLKQYRLLEEKEDAKAEFSSNDEFLMSCNIRVDVYDNCEQELDRIHELLLRSNQLNYTKFRQDKEGLLEAIRNPEIKTGYVKVQDKFGDYGIVGFYAVKNNKLIHYAFSCRTLGMKIEQYIYYVLGCPELTVVGDVVTVLNNTEKPAWINQIKEIKNIKDTAKNSRTYTSKVLFKGPCDMSQMYAFLNLSGDVVTEFTYINEDGISVEGHNHTSQIVTSLYTNETRKKEILSDVDFFDKDMLSTVLKDQKFDYVVLSMLTDGNLGIYKRKTGEEVALCQKRYSLVDKENQEKYIKGEIFTSRISFTAENLEKFSSEYSFVDNNDAQVTVDNLQKIWEYIGNDTTLILLLGSEREFKKKCDESYRDRHNEHRIMNQKIAVWSEGKDNVVLLKFDQYLKNDFDFIDTIDHFAKRVYYDLACDLANIFSQDKTNHVEVKSKSVLIKATIKQRLRVIKAKIKKIFHISK